MGFGAKLAIASADEHAEGFKLYPSFAKVAQKEGFCDVATLFTNIANVEKRHEKIFSELYSQMKNKTLYKSDKPIKWKCPVCGYEEVLTEAWQECPVCKSKQGTVMLHLTSTK